jgi:hypothetical protein
VTSCAFKAFLFALFSFFVELVGDFNIMDAVK